MLSHFLHLLLFSYASAVSQPTRIAQPAMREREKKITSISIIREVDQNKKREHQLTLVF